MCLVKFTLNCMQVCIWLTDEILITAIVHNGGVHMCGFRTSLTMHSPFAMFSLVKTVCGYFRTHPLDAFWPPFTHVVVTLWLRVS